MTDLEITLLCAEAMGYKPGEHYHWRPLHDDAQAMALVKKFRLNIHAHDEQWKVEEWGDDGAMALHETLNRAICECVAKMQAAKK